MMGRTERVRTTGPSRRARLRNKPLQGRTESGPTTLFWLNAFAIQIAARATGGAEFILEATTELKGRYSPARSQISRPRERSALDDDLAVQGERETVVPARIEIRNLMASGVSQSVVMSISGHRTISVFNRYNIASQADKVAAFERRDEKFATPKRKLAFARGV
jgi:hypothetical protein